MFNSNKKNNHELKIYGHRGARGLYPENSIIGFKKTLEMDVAGIECDICMSKDNIIITYHDLTLNPDITKDINNNWIIDKTPINNISYSTLKTYSIGQIKPYSDYAKKFPNQKIFDKVHIPKLDEILTLIKMSEKKLIIEIKNNTSHLSNAPNSAILIKELIKLINLSKTKNKIQIISFDWKVIKKIQNKEPHFDLGFISSSQEKNMLSSLFNRSDKHHYDEIPAILAKNKIYSWSLYYQDAIENPDIIKKAKSYGININCWTVNNKKELDLLKKLGVHSITTDYPNML